MKKNLFFAALAITALVSCSESDYLGDERPSPVSRDEVAIGFGSGLRAITRADVTGAAAADSLGGNFVVYGVKSDGTPFGATAVCDTVFDHYNVNWGANTANTTTSNTANWEYVGQAKHQYGPAGDQTIKYWDYAKSQYDFIAYSKGKDNDGLTVTEINVKKLNGEKTNDVITDGAYKISGTAAELAKAYIADLVTVCRDNPTALDGGHFGEEVNIKFRSLSAKVRIGLYETVPGYSVKDVVFYSAENTQANPSSGTWGTAHLYTSGTGNVFNESGTYIVYFPTTGTAYAPDSAQKKTDYNKAHLKFVAGTDGTKTDKEFGTLTGSLAAANLAAAEKAETAGNYYLGRTSNTAIYAGAKASNYYTTVIPNEDGVMLNLKVDYTLLSTDGSGEPIRVTGATAKVPAVYAAWKSGYAYTYLFKISQNTNGFTNPAITGKAGLYPITLDAVVVNDEADGIQETITTVAEPSITTYAKGKVVTENDEYLPSSKIYVIVEDNGAVQTLSTTNAKLYTVKLDAGAAQTINEATVANVLANGTHSGDTWTVTDKNEKNMVVTATSGLLTMSDSIGSADAPDGNKITVNCAYFTPSSTAADTVYVFEYIKTARTYYTQEEAKTYNAALPGAIKTTDVAYSFTSYASDKTTEYGTGKVKELSKVGEWTNVLVTDNSVESFVGKEYKVHATTVDTNTYYDLYTTAGAATGIYVKIQAANYDPDEVNTYNATLSGAVSTSTVKNPGKYGYKIIRIKR